MGRPRDQAEQIIMEVGGEIFGQPEIANEALDEFEVYCQPGDDPIIVAWEMFTHLLDVYGATIDAFEKAWPLNGVVPFAIGKGLTPQDAEDISQKTAWMVWKQFFDFKPWLSAWNTWILMIAERQIMNFFRDTYKEKDSEDVDEIEIVKDVDITIDKQGWAIPVICQEWVESGNERKARFAVAILAAHYNLDWVAPGSQRMANITGTSRTNCLRMFEQFVREVIYREKYGK